MPRILLFLFVIVGLLTQAIPALALELTHRIPESVKRLEVRMEHTPSYQEVYGRYEKRVPLREWLFENEATTVFGTVSRSETRIHFDYDWGWTDDWTVSVSSAVVHKSQTANLSGGSGLELPESGSVTGLGDTTISLRKELFASTTWFSVGGMQLVLPTGTAGQAIGHSPNAIGERQTDVGGFFRFTWYPLAPGWRNGFGLQILSQLKGARKNYLGERRRSTVVKGGRKATTLFIPVRNFEGYGLVEIELGTGRMHQIRAHAAALGHPVAGDQKYGSHLSNRKLRHFGLKRLFLHAAEVKLEHPETGQTLCVQADIPESLKHVMEKLQ